MEIGNPGQIERELQRKVLAASGTGIRASLFNLVIFERPEEPGPVDAALGALFGRRPARIVRVESGPGGPTRVEVSALCATDPQAQGVCFEEIRIYSGADGLGRDPGYWAPLLIHSEPIYLWWLEATEALGPFLPQVEQIADRLIVDTGRRERRGEQPLAGLRFLAGEAESVSGLADFSWHRILPLRRWTARLFDPPENRDSLERIERVRLEGGGRSEALLLFLWLASRLGWEGESLEEDRYRFRDRSAKPVLLEHLPGRAPAAGFQAGFRLEFGIRDRPPLALRCDESGCALLDRPGAGELAVRLRFPDDGEILLAEVDAGRADPAYLQALLPLRLSPFSYG